MPCVDSLAVDGKGSWNLSLLGRVYTLMKSPFYCRFMNILNVHAQCTCVDAYTMYNVHVCVHACIYIHLSYAER